MSQGRTNDLGEYRIAELPPGDYYLQAKRQLSGADADEWSGTVYYPNVDARRRPRRFRYRLARKSVALTS
jgi:hypothetical protein